MRAPWPLIEVAIEPKSGSDTGRLERQLAELTLRDPDVIVTVDPDSGQTILGGTGELHLDAVIEDLRRDCDLHVGAPQVGYRETITRRAQVDYTHKLLNGGASQFARIKIVAEPTDPATGFAFKPEINREPISDDYMSGIEAGLLSVAKAGVQAGFPVVGVTVELLDYAFHEVGSSRLAFEIAARAAMREALRNGGSILIEPIMTVMVSTSVTHAGRVLADLKSRWATIEPHAASADPDVITAKVPLARLFGYPQSLRSLTDGSGTVAMAFAGYEPVPKPDDDRPPPAVASALRA